MKKVRGFLAMSAVLLAVGGAFAQFALPTTSVFEYLTSPDRCIARTAAFDCTTVHATDAPICATTAAPSVQLKELNSPSTQCGLPMWKTIQ